MTSKAILEQQMFSFFKIITRLGMLAALYYLVFTKEGSHFAEKFIQKNLRNPKNIAFLKHKISKLTGFDVDEIVRYGEIERKSNSDED